MKRADAVLGGEESYTHRTAETDTETLPQLRCPRLKGDTKKAERLE